MSKLIHVIAAAYERLPELRVFIQSWINQTSEDWQLTVIHDGKSQAFTNLMNEPNYIHPNIKFFCTERRYNDYGHSLRDLGLKYAKGQYTILTNGDNYFIPLATEIISESIGKLDDYSLRPDIILFDMIHSHANPGARHAKEKQQPVYNLFKTSFKPYCIDVSSAAVKTELAKSVGFRDKGFDADQAYFNDIALKVEKLKIMKLKHVLLVHN